MSFNFSYLWDSLVSGVHYINISLLLAFVPLLVGTIFGFLIALIRFFKVPVLARFFDIIVPIYNGIPSIVAIFIYNLIYLTYGHPSPDGVIYVGILCFSIGHISHFAETFRGALFAIPKGQYEACYACGLTTKDTLLRVIIPQLVPVVIPAFTNMTVGAIKNSSIVMAIGVTEVLNGATIPCANTYSFLEGYVAAALIYWVLNIIAETLLRRAEKHFSKFKGEALK